MTYCVGIKLDAGLVFLSDSRTNAGLDQINTFRKMMVLKAQRGLGIDVVRSRHLRRVVLDKCRQGLAQIVDVGGTGPQYFGRAGVVQQSEQQVFYGDELVALLARLDKGHMQADFKFLGNHVVSFCLCFDV